MPVLRLVSSERLERVHVAANTTGLRLLGKSVSLLQEKLMRDLLRAAPARVGSSAFGAAMARARRLGADLGPTLALPSPRMDVRARAEIWSGHICVGRLAPRASDVGRGARPMRDWAMPAWHIRRLHPAEERINDLPLRPAADISAVEDRFFTLRNFPLTDGTVMARPQPRSSTVMSGRR